MKKLLLELVHGRSRALYQQPFGNTHRQQQNFHSSHVLWHEQDFLFLSCGENEFLYKFMNLKFRNDTYENESEETRR